MAVLKYKNGEGQFVTLTNYTVQPIVPVQTTGTSLTDVMSQKAVSDEVNSKVNESDLNEKIASAITNDNGVKDAINSQVSDAISSDNTVKEAVDEAIADAIANASAVTEAVEDVVDEKLTAYTSTEDADLRYAFKEHTHAASSVTDLSSTVENIISSSTTIETRIESVVTSAVTGSGEVNEAVEKAVEDALKDNEQVSGAVNTIIEEYTTTVLDGKYAEKSHTHTVSDINDFDNAVAESVKTEITNNNSAITESIESVVEKYIYGDSEPSSTASVVTTDNLTTTLADYAKSEDIPTDLGDFTNSPKYVKESEVNDLIATAITESQAVIDAVNSAITSAITSDTAVQTAIDAATSNKFGEVEYDNNSKRINFYATSAKTSVIDYIDATDFIKDGMVDNVAISGSDLVITFNTDAGKEPIRLALTDIFNPNNYYTKSETSGKSEISTALNGKANSSHTHSTSDINGFNAAISSAIASDASVSGAIESIVSDYTYDKDTIDNKIGSGGTFDPTLYYKKSETSGKSEISTALNGKSDIGHTHTASQITDFNAAVSGAVKSSTDVKNEIISAVTASTEFSTLSGNVNAVSGSVNTLSDTVTAHTSDTSIHFTASSGITSMAGYAKASAAADIATGDTLNVAMGKLEKKIDSAVAGGVSSVELGSGTTNGTLTLKVNGALQDTVNVPGLGGAAFLNTGTTAGTVAAGNHTHTANQITDFNAAVSGAVKNNTDVKNEIISAVTASTEFTTLSGNVNTLTGSVNTLNGNVNTISGNVSTLSGNLDTVSGKADTAKAVTDFMSGHNTVTTLGNIPTDKRLVIATIDGSSNELSLSNNTLTDGYEIHIIVKNNGSNDVTISLPSSGGYVSVGDAISIEAGATGEINIISDGTNKYVRGV